MVQSHVPRGAPLCVDLHLLAGEVRRVAGTSDQ